MMTERQPFTPPGQQLNELRSAMASDRVAASEAESALDGVAVAQGIVAMLFGGGLIVSHIADDLPRLTPAYDLIAGLPVWPMSVGLVILLAGLLQIAAHVTRRGRTGTATFALALTAVVWSVYFGLYFAGTVINGGLWGPQIIYAGLALVATVQARYAWSRQRRGR